MKQITVDYKGTTYTLEFTRKSIEVLERNGFVIDEISDKPATRIPQLFAGAFYSKHRFVKQGVIDEIFDAIPNKQELAGKLAEMYVDALDSIIGTSDDEGAEGNAVWGASWE